MNALIGCVMADTAGVSAVTATEIILSPPCPTFELLHASGGVKPGGLLGKTLGDLMGHSYPPFPSADKGGTVEGVLGRGQSGRGEASVTVAL